MKNIVVKFAFALFVVFGLLPAVAKPAHAYTYCPSGPLMMCYLACQRSQDCASGEGYTGQEFCSMCFDRCDYQICFRET